MPSNKIITSIVWFFLLVAWPILGLSAEEVIDEQQLEETTRELTGFVELIAQINSEILQSKGTEARALGKQLLLTESSYRDLLWQFVDDLEQFENKADLGQFNQFASSHLLKESEVLKKEIKKNLIDTADLEEKIISGKYDFSYGAQDKLSALKAKLSKKRKTQGKTYSTLVKNAQELAKSGKDASQDYTYVKPLVKRQADMLSGLIGFEKAKLAKLQKKLSIVSNESKEGKKILSDIRAQNQLIQHYADRLQDMVKLLEVEGMDVDASLYKKTVLQSKSVFSKDILDKKVASHLFTEWWLKTKKWFFKKAPELLGKTVTFLAIILFSILIAALVKKMIRRIFSRTLPDMSELAKKFIVSMSSKLVILVGFLLALSNMGVQIGPLLAGLGIMGFVIGFALQDTLSNFASGLMILVYRPYDVGDKVKCAGVKGKVKKMNLVSTTIITSEYDQLTVPNSKIWGNIIDNITSLPLHRVDLHFMTPYNSDSETALTIIADEVNKCSSVHHDKKKIVRVDELGKSEVDYLARFWVTSTDNLKEAQWTISEGVKKRFDKEGISLDIAEAAKG